MVMKKNFLIFGLISAALVFSCTKESTQDDPVVTPSENTEEATPVTPVADGNLLTSFGVTFEGDTKVTVDLDNGNTAIETDDEVLVFVDTDNNAIYIYDGSKFVLKEGETAVSLDAPASVFYPAAKFEKTTGKFIMPDGIVATGDFGAINPMAGQITGTAGSYSVELGNIASILRVKVTADVNINSVTLDYGSAIYFAAGSKYTVNALEKTMAYASEASDDTFEKVTLTTPATSADVLFIVPTVGLPNGLTVTANLAENHNGGADTFTVTNANTDARARNTISTMNFYAGLFSGGTGAENDPYKIANARDFKNIANYTKNGYGSITAAAFLSAYYEQTADIDFKDATLTSIGVYDGTASNAIPFTGYYDGGGKTLSNFIVTGTKEGSAGLFEYVSGGNLKNIKLEHARITATNTAGLLAGRCIGSTKIEGCSLDGGQIEGRNSVGFIAHIVGNVEVKGCSVKNLTIITAASGSDAHNQGGIVGFAGGNSSINACTTSGDIQFTGTASGSMRGGIVGRFDSTNEVKGCTNGADISSQLVNYTGGIAGQLTKGTITECDNTGDVTGLGYVGGITGAMHTNSSACVYVNKCRVNATIKGTGTANTDICVGGIVGSMQNGVLNTCIAKGSVENSWYDTGGIVGQVYANGTSAVFNRPYVFDCIAANDVKCTRTSGSANIGGVVGRIFRNSSYTDQYTAVDNCIGLNQTITATLQYSGAFVGNVNASATNNNRVRVRNCISLVDDSHLQVNTSANFTGGFAGAYLGALIHCYYLVSDNNQTAVAGTTAASNLTKSDLATLTSTEFCTAHSSRAAGYNLTVSGVQYKSSGWTKPQDVDYPVPTTLYNLGSEYYK